MKHHFDHHSRKKPWLRWLVIGLLIVVLILAVATASLYMSYQNGLKPVSTSDKSQLITIHTGTSAEEIANLLQQEKLISSTWAFGWYLRLNDVRNSLQAGTYSLRPNMSVPEIVSVISRGKVDTKLFTILPGQRLIDQVKDKLIEAGYSEDEVDTALNPATYEGHPALEDKPADASLEGYVYPESFQRTSTTSAQGIIRAALDQMDKRLTPQLKAAFSKQGLTTHQAIIMASIVEKEVSNTQDRATVAQVFLKRLREDISLGADPTAVYGAVLAGQEPSIYYESPYNTHTHAGLPPSPISSVTEHSLNAVANPANTSWLYFVAGEDCITRFSATFAEHERLIAEHGLSTRSESCN